MSRPGIVLAGGEGTRLRPVTRAVSKQLLPVYDKPLVHYPISTLMLAGIRDLLVITAPSERDRFEALLGDGSRWGVEIRYAVQEEPRGIADAFRVGRDFVGEGDPALVLGDNVFHGHGLTDVLREAAARETGATIFAYRVRDPSSYGVVDFGEDGAPRGIVEKPERPPSPWAVTGLYFYDNRVLDVVEELEPSERGELEITDVNRRYLEWGELEVERLGRGHAWLDAGTHDSLLSAAEFVRTVEERQGRKVACLEEVAYRMGYIGEERLLELADGLEGTGHGAYLRRVAQEG